MLPDRCNRLIIK